ncbi:MAG: hypothetical protein ACC645_14395 [Pirellulales bacterium]
MIRDLLIRGDERTAAPRRLATARVDHPVSPSTDVAGRKRGSRTIADCHSLAMARRDSAYRAVFFT